MIQSIDAAAYTEMIKSGAALIERNKQFVNELNVFPVPDGDTGTNMSMTINAGVPRGKGKLGSYPLPSLPRYVQGAQGRPGDDGRRLHRRP